MKEFLFILSMTALLALQANAEVFDQVEYQNGDFNRDGHVTITDLNLLTAAVFNGNSDLFYDLNDDSVVNISDISVLIGIILEPKSLCELIIDEQHSTGKWLVLVNKYAEYEWYQLHAGTEPLYVTTFTFCYDGDRWGYYVWDPELSEEENEANKPTVPLCFVIDGVRYGAPTVMQPTVVGVDMSYSPLDNPLIESNEFYTLSIGNAYLIGFWIDNNTGDYYVYAIKDKLITPC